ncbi:MAG: hypothetical protein ACJA2M_000268 [Polaribacter sp.]|jgi:hypothetical protein
MELSLLKFTDILFAEKPQVKYNKITLNTQDIFLIFDYNLQVFEFFDIFGEAYKASKYQLEMTINYLNKIKENGVSNN